MSKRAKWLFTDLRLARRYALFGNDRDAAFYLSECRYHAMVLISGVGA